MTTTFDRVAPPGANRAAPPIDFPRLLGVAGGDRQLVAQLVGVYLEQVPTLVAQIESALVGRDGGALRRAAHALKGSLLSLAADEAAAAANALEFLGPNRGWLPEAVAARHALARELARVDEAIRARFVA